MKSRSRLIAAVGVCGALFFGAAPGVADWKAFTPVSLENGAFVELLASFERDDANGGRHTQWTDLFFREKLTLYSNGYSYHPRFARYHFSVSGAGKQEYYDSTSVDPGWDLGSGLEYNTRVRFLPEHPYNLEVYSLRYEPLFKEQSAVGHDSVATSHGASLRYRQKPYFLRAGFDDDSIDSGQASSDVQRVNLDGEYFKRFEGGGELSFDGAFNPTWFENSQGVEGSSTEYLAGNRIGIERGRLSSNVSHTSFDQMSSSSGRFESEQFAWYELLTAYLPWNFRSNAAWRYHDNDGRFDDVRRDGVRRLSSTDKTVQVDLLHRLYQSLDTNYSFLRDWRSSSGADTRALSHSVGFNYTKLIPYGRLLTGASLGRTETENRGDAADILNESYSAIGVPGVFTLRQQNVLPGSITLFLRSPLPPFELIPLEENVHYIAIPVLSSFEVQIITLPPELVVPGSYDFLVSYSLTGGDFDLRYDTLAGNASVELFDHLVTPYVGYVTVRSRVLSGTFPGIPLDSTTYTTGVIFHRGPVRLRGEYQKRDWEVGPYEAWRAELQYVTSLGVRTNIHAIGSYLNKHYTEGVSPFDPDAFTEETATASCQIRRQLFVRNMFLSGGASYSRLAGRADTDAYSANASWIWSVGRLDLSAGATAYGADTTGTSHGSTSRERQLVYFKLRRRLF